LLTGIQGSGVPYVARTCGVVRAITVAATSGLAEAEGVVLDAAVVTTILDGKAGYLEAVAVAGVAA